MIIFLFATLITFYSLPFIITFSGDKSRIQIRKASKLQETLSKHSLPEIPTLKGVKTKINTIVPTDEIESVRIRHISLATEELANECFKLLVEFKAEFADLASKISICEFSKFSGGEVGWISSITSDEPQILPPEVINAAYQINKGDIIVTPGSVSGAKTWHVLQLMDVSARLNKNLAKRRYDNYMSVKGLDKDTAALSYSIETMGCQMNFADSERIEGQLRDMGYSRTEDSATANLVILNTCSIREHAEHKVYSHIGPHALRKRKGEDVSIMVTGCVAQQEGEALTKRFPEVYATYTMIQ